MKSGHILALLIFAAPAPAFADWSAGMVLGKLPPMPHDADSAYSQWTDKDGILTKGPVFANYEKTVNDVGQAMIMTMQGGGGSMTPGAVSPHDQAVLQRLQPYPGTMALRTQMAQAGATLAKLRAEMQAQIEALGPQEAADDRSVPMCPGEAGAPEPGAAAAIAEKYAQKRVTIASDILGREAVAINAIRQQVSGETSYADRAYASWHTLAPGMMKTSSSAVVIGMEASALGDVGVVLGYIEDASKDAADTVAKRNKLTRLSADAPHGCN